jgi:hypothetical protein
LLAGDFLIDCFDELPLGRHYWKPVILARNYNQNLVCDHTLPSWTDWKRALGLDADLVTIASFRHGSEDSRDADILYQVSIWPSSEHIQRFVSGSGDEDRNVFQCSESGFVERCFKGLPDEVNNGLFSTYSLHAQKFPLPIRNSVQRSVLARAAVAMRSMCAEIRFPRFKTVFLS